ncbi:MAG: YdcF family protein [Lachnospiraceae bacterium]|nr:YdcF family protein [Lachnospiraceae bacterium]
MKVFGNIFVLLFYAASLISGGAFFHRLYKERRSMWTGTLLSLFLLSLFFSSVFTVFTYSQEIQKSSFWMGVLTVSVTALALFLVFFPLAFLLLYFIQGIQILRKEGFKFHNLLSLAFSIGLFLFLFLFPRVSFFEAYPVLEALYLVVILSLSYLLFLAAMYAFSAVLNLVHLRKNQGFHYIIVLGCGILGEKMTPLLRNRVDKGISLLEKNPDAKLVLSGGMGPGESITEAECMKRYVLSKGISASRILIEDQSKNTYENLLFSKAKIEEDSSEEKPSLAIVTTSYHVFRALILAKKLHISCKGFGGKTKWYFTLNAILREFVAYLRISYRTHLCVIVSVNLLALFAYYFYKF